MNDKSTTLFGLPVPSDDPLFIAIVTVHIILGVICVAAAVTAMLSRKGSPVHKLAGKTYFIGLTTLFLTIIVASILQWPHDLHLLIIGSGAFVSVFLGRSAAKRQPPRWPRMHTIWMGTSFILLVTGFYVDNGRNLPLLRLLPQWSYWVLPSVIGIPIIVGALRMHPLNKTEPGT